MIVSPASKTHAALGVAMMPGGIGAAPDAVHVRRLNSARSLSDAAFRPLAGPRHAGEGISGAAAAAAVALLSASVATPHLVHSPDEISLIEFPAGVARLDAFDAGWYVYPPGSTRGRTVRDGSGSVFSPLPEGCIDTTQSAARGNAINQ